MSSGIPVFNGERRGGRQPQQTGERRNAGGWAGDGGPVMTAVRVLFGLFVLAVLITAIVYFVRVDSNRSAIRDLERDVEALMNSGGVDRRGAAARRAHGPIDAAGAAGAGGCAGGASLDGHGPRCCHTSFDCADGDSCSIDYCVRISDALAARVDFFDDAGIKPHNFCAHYTPPYAMSEAHPDLVDTTPAGSNVRHFSINGTVAVPLGAERQARVPGVTLDAFAVGFDAPFYVATLNRDSNRLSGAHANRAAAVAYNPGRGEEPARC